MFLHDESKRRSMEESMMRKLGIIGAMEEEVDRLKEQMDKVNVQTIASMDFYQGYIGEKELVVVRSGIGKVNAAICCQILINIYDIDAVINTGVAGSLRNDIDITDIVLSKDAIQHDVDARGFGYEKGVIPRMDRSNFIADEKLIKLAQLVCEQEIPEVGIHLGRIVTGDQFISDDISKEEIVEEFGGYCTEMEGAAIAQVAYLNQKPFLIIRAISDKADHSAEMDYSEFEEVAINNTMKLLLGMIESC